MKRLMVFFIAFVLLFTFAAPQFGFGDTLKSEELPFTVVFVDETLPNNASEIIRELGGEVIYEIPEIGVIQAKAPASFVKKAVKHPSILVVTPSLITELPEIKSIPLEMDGVNLEKAVYYNMYQWDIKRVTNNGKSFELGTGNHEVVVGIIDSGIDLNHPDIQANLLPGSKNFVPKGGIYGVDLSETGNLYDVQDRNGHGTHVAGTIAGNGVILGVAPDVGIRAYRVFGAEGGAYNVWIIKALIAAANDGVNVINMSLGGIYIKGQVWWTDPDTGERIKLGNDVADYVAYMRAAKYAEKKGALIVVAAGNDGLNATNRKEVIDYANEKYGPYGYEFKGAGFYTPASLPNVVTVSATGPNDELAMYSNYGAGFVDVAAPGGNLELYYKYLNEGRFDEYINQRLYTKEFNLSSVPIVQYQYNDKGQIIGYTYVRPGYSWYVGTSMATPKASAVAALLFAKHKDASPSQVKVMLQNSAEKIGKPGKDIYFGYGLVNAYRALTMY
ncbi:S8 family peptidase [Caldanaerobacter subterraneus]|uniref:Subtilase family protein n=1 Tax=Caldanaerobacter subterraneus TaxID=911092 RepID=A0A4R2JW33_9THEO|nr:S8 family serine peptidase [Caldanaerobacter subterraneus]TCO61516.1 subtilase family protein [Caldanaerobacter subterraneus]